jgi:hypothetical protein
MYHGIRIEKSKTLLFSDNATGAKKKVVSSSPYFMAYPVLPSPPPKYTGYV